jgi:amino acid adenylation domain-containing protein/thioester reductase-like protein
MEKVPLSDAQIEIIQLQEYYENTSINNIAGIVNIKNKVTISEIEKALNNLIKNHDSYRIKIKKENSEYEQYISEHKDKNFNVVDFTNDQEEYRHWIDEQVSKNIFSINNDLFEFTIIKLPEGKTGILLLQHHVISDGWSMTIAVNTICNYLIDGTKTETLEPSYFDHVREELKYKNSERFKKDKQFWIEKLENLEDNELFKKNATNCAQGDRQSFNLTDAYTVKLLTFCEKNNISISNLFTTAMIILKYKKTLAEKISVGSIMHNRNKKMEKELTGAFSRTLPIIVDVSSNNSISDLLTKTKYESFNLLKHRKYPYRKIIEDNGSKSGILDCMVSFQNKQYDSKIIENGYSDEWLDNGSNNTSLAISISNRNRDNSLAIDYDYQVAVVNEKEIADLHNFMLKIIETAIENPNKQIKDIEIISEDEKRTILNEFNNTEMNLNNTQTFVERFENQVAQTPNQTAVTYEGDSLSYSELNVKANQLAHQLRHKGVKANHLVGIMTNRHLEMIIGIYGILKAGGAYVPIDPNYPSERINYILTDSNAYTLLTDSVLDTSIEFNQTVINLKEDINTSIQPTDNLSYTTNMSDLMCIIYTSGTTGKPKGVKIPYKSVMNNLNRRINRFDISSNDNILFKMPFTFDPSIWELFGWAIVGAQATLLPSGEEGNPEIITSLIQMSKVTMAVFVPSMFIPFIDYIKSTKQAHLLSSLNHVLVGGEAVTPKLVNQFNEWIGKKNNTQLTNVYGPTETTIDVTNFDFENNIIYDAVPIGQPIANTQAYIMNEDNNLMGIGVPGELCIGGVGVTEGYLNRPQLTKERFIDNPFGKGKLYRTGDLAKWNVDGNISYLGRIDEQVKIRGYRIELGEIENTLRRIDQVSDVTVVAKPMRGEELAICAYLLSDEKIAFDDIKTKLSEKLPTYMIPSYMTQIDKLPVTPNGKLDKKQLPEIKVESKTYIEPSNKMENIVAEAFESILNMNRVSVQDNFFEIGGDSIKAIKLTSLLSRSYNISIKDIFELKTVRCISKALLERGDTNTIEKLNTLKDINREQKTHFHSEFMNAINDYKEKSTENYKNIDKNIIKLDKQVLLTGATGYFGIHVLKDLLARTDFTIYIMVRNSEELSGEMKLKENWLYYFDSPLKPKYEKRIHFVEGNIEMERLGFDNDTYEYLTNNVDIIINAAANVNHFATENSSYKTNVNAINNLAKFAKENKPKEIHHMSTKSVASGNIENKKFVIFSEDDIDIGQKPNNVYMDGKIEAEKLLVAYRDEGIQTNIYRLGNLQCDSETGIFQKNEENNAFYNIIKSFKKLQKYPKLDNLDFTPVNKAAQACNKLILNNQLQNEIYHVYNTHFLPFKKLMSIYNENGNYIEDVHWNDFMDYLIECIELDMLNDEVNTFLLHTGILDNTLFNKSHFETLDYKTNFILEKLDFQWRPITSNLLTKMVSHTKNNF